MCLLFKPKPLIITGCLLCLFSCINSDYDLSKGINTDMTISEGSISFPLGNTEEIRLSNFLKESEEIQLEDGLYTIRKRGQTDKKQIDIDPIVFSVGAYKLNPIYIGFMNNVIVPTGFYYERQLTTSGYVNIDTRVPNEVVSIHQAIVKEDSDAELEVSFRLPEGFTNKTEVIFTDIEVAFPDFIKLDDSRAKGQVLYLDGEYDPREPITAKVSISELDFRMFNDGEGVETTKENGATYFRIDTDNMIAVTGIVKVGNIDFNGLGNLIITPVISVSKLAVGKVRGYFKPDMGAMEEGFNMRLDDEIEFLKENSSMSLHNPQFFLDINNTFAVPFDLRVRIRAERDGMESVVTDPIVLNVYGANDDGAANNRFFISRQGSEKEGCRTIVAHDLDKLFKVIPDRIYFNLEVLVNENHVHEIDLTTLANNFISATYQMDLPFEFEEINLNYTKTFTGLQEKIERFADNENDIELKIATRILNTIPLDFDVSLAALDTQEQVLPSIKSSMQIIAAGNKDKEPTITDAVFSLTIPKGTISEIDALNFVINGKANQEEAKIAIHEDCFIQLTDISVMLTGGISIDIDGLE